MTTQEIQYTIELYWKTHGDVYKTKTSTTVRMEQSTVHVSHLNYYSYKNDELHSIDGEHSVYELCNGGGVENIREEFHKDGKSHNIYGPSEYYFEHGSYFEGSYYSQPNYSYGDNNEISRYYIEGEYVEPYEYDQKAEEYKHTIKQHMKNALLQHTDISKDVCGIISEYVI
jgi:hypothetical protein